MNLNNLPRNARARIIAIHSDDTTLQKLLALGVIEGTEVQIMHQGLVRRDPIGVRVDDRMIAIRRKEARHIEVELL